MFLFVFSARAAQSEQLDGLLQELKMLRKEVEDLKSQLGSNGPDSARTAFFSRSRFTNSDDLQEEPLFVPAGNRKEANFMVDEYDFGDESESLGPTTRRAAVFTANKGAQIKRAANYPIIQSRDGARMAFAKRTRYCNFFGFGRRNPPIIIADGGRASGFGSRGRLCNFLSVAEEDPYEDIAEEETLNYYKPITIWPRHPNWGSSDHADSGRSSSGRSGSRTC